MPTTPLQSEVLRQAARDLAEAAHGDRSAIVDRTAQLLGLSRGRTYALIRQTSAGIALPQRKRRADAGETAATDDDLRLIAGVLSEGRRANGKAMWSIERAIEVLAADGKLSAALSPSRVSRLMRERGMHPDQLAAPSPATRMRSDHPNDVWQLDASVCVLYRTPKGELALMEREAFYKNKLHNVAKVVNDLVVRYVGADHCSGCIGPRFYLGGETTENALEHLIWLMQARTGPEGLPVPFHGVPRMVYTDQGSPFKSGPFVNFCERLDIKLLHHAPRNSRATGLVESAQNIVERGLEGTLRFLDPESVTMARLNALADQWMHWFNGTRRHSRHGMTRYSAWSMVTAEQLRLAPPEELLRALPTSQPETRRVSNDMLIEFTVKGYGKGAYDVRYVRGAAPAEKVLVAVNPFEAPAVNVGVTDHTTGEIVWTLVRPIERNAFGFDAAAPKLGESYRAMPNTVVDEQRNAIARQAYAVEGEPATLEDADKARRSKAAPFLGQINPLADLEQAKVPAYIPRRGMEHPVQARQAEVPRLNVVEACKRLKALLGEQYTPQVYSWMSARFADEGVPEDQLEQLARQFGLADSAPEAAQPGGLQLVQPLRAAGGEA